MAEGLMDHEISAAELAGFRATVLAEGELRYRDLPWRHTHDPYAIWISEVMLQQTQVSRVNGRWQRWLRRFPDVASLSRATVADVLEEWQGMGYNRRALALRKAAQVIAQEGGQIPQGTDDLVALPGVGPATAAGIRAFAFDLPGVYLETNVRAVFLYEFFAKELDVPDARIVPLVKRTCPSNANDARDDPRSWYYALLDYGAYLKASKPNPSRRARNHVRQSAYCGSHRQKRAELVRIMLGFPDGCDLQTLAAALSSIEQEAGRRTISVAKTSELLAELASEGFCRYDTGVWHV
jgi:A/G-specific adenine glycosylase